MEEDAGVEEKGRTPGRLLLSFSPNFGGIKLDATIVLVVNYTTVGFDFSSLPSSHLRASRLSHLSRTRTWMPAIISPGVASTRSIIYVFIVIIIIIIIIIQAHCCIFWSGGLHSEPAGRDHMKGYDQGTLLFA